MNINKEAIINTNQIRVSGQFPRVDKRINNIPENINSKQWNDILLRADKLKLAQQILETKLNFSVADIEATNLIELAKLKGDEEAHDSLNSKHWITRDFHNYLINLIADNIEVDFLCGTTPDKNLPIVFKIDTRD